MSTGQRSRREHYGGQVIIITGEEDQGQNIAAMHYIREALQRGIMLFHNGCSTKGFEIKAETLADQNGFLEILDAAPNGSTFVIADADCCPAITGGPTDAESEWLSLSKKKGHDVILTTVRGMEHKLNGPLADTGTMHLYVSSVQHLPGLFMASSFGAMKERVPVNWWVVNEKRTLSYASLTNGMYESPSRPEGELIVSPLESLVVPTDYTDAVRSTGTAKPKHPENPILLTKTVKRDTHIQEKTTEIIFLPWLESVNKQRDEDMAVGSVEWACKRWGIGLQIKGMNPNTTYPDAWGEHEGQAVNLEVRKVQPKWPNGKTLASISDVIRAGKATAPQGSPVVQCKQCGSQEDKTITDVHELPTHDSSHEWVCTYPKDMIGPEWTENLTTLPNLMMRPGDLLTAVTEAVDEKDDRARRFGQGKQNWLILSVEGFPLDERLHEELACIDWKGLDAVFLILTSQFGSAIYQNEIDDNRIIVIARCPSRTDHVCYHPGIRTSTRKAGREFQTLREETVASGLVYQVVNADGSVLAEDVRELELPMSDEDLMKGIMRAVKRLPFQPTETEMTPDFETLRTDGNTGPSTEP